MEIPFQYDIFCQSYSNGLFRLTEGLREPLSFFLFKGFGLKKQGREKKDPKREVRPPSGNLDFRMEVFVFLS
jgi:hypothetical protein